MAKKFFAFLSRMKYIERWSLMRSTQTENIAEHSYYVAVLAHALGVIRRDVFGKPCDPEQCATGALYHDIPEILTGDLPTPIKYFNPEIRGAYRRVEQIATEKLLAELPEQMRGSVAGLVREQDPGVRELVRAADKLSAYLKCVEEMRMGNREFSCAKAQQEQALHAMRLPEVEYFLSEFAPAFELTLDELQ